MGIDPLRIGPAMNDAFSDPIFVAQYMSFRGVGEGVWLKYRAILENIIVRLSRPARVLDVGSGPGTFALWMAQNPDLFSEIVAMDSSRKMINELEQRLDKLTEVLVRPVLADFLGEKLELGTFDLILMSQVVHLFDDPRAALVRAKGLLSENGSLAIRTSNWDQLRTAKFYQYFPEALELDLSRHSENLLNDLRAIDLDAEMYVVDEPHRWSRDQYLARLTARPTSTLRAISTEAFVSGLDRATKALQGVDSIEESRQMTLYIASRRSATV